ncbi:MAG TPA: sigma-70 family RNA polymerase sigma factor [Solirubrobacterales bacterium]|nr:sigma-70 family RNA polymerase sigma factor [Solirubrobacterales bacterium]
MEATGGRSSGVEQTLAAPATEIPSDADAAFEALYRSSRDDVYAYVAGLLRDRSAAEDVTAAAFERAYGRRARFDARRGTPRAWLFGIARNAALDELRRRRRHAELAAEPADDAAAPDAAAEVGVRRAALRGALARLSPRERELVALKFFAGLGNAEIAAVLGVSETNAGTRLHRTIQKLRRACDEAA